MNFDYINKIEERLEEDSRDMLRRYTEDPKTVCSAKTGYSAESPQRDPSACDFARRS